MSIQQEVPCATKEEIEASNRNNPLFNKAVTIAMICHDTVECWKWQKDVTYKKVLWEDETVDKEIRFQWVLDYISDNSLEKVNFLTQESELYFGLVDVLDKIIKNPKIIAEKPKERVAVHVLTKDAGEKQIQVFRERIFPIEISLNVSVKSLSECENMQQAVELIESLGYTESFYNLIGLSFQLNYPFATPIPVWVEFAGSLADILYPIAKIYKDTIYGNETNEFGVFGHGIEDLFFEKLILQDSNCSILSEIWLGS